MNLANDKRSRHHRVLVTIILALGAIAVLLPLYYIFITSFKTLEESIGTFTWWPKTFTPENFKEVFSMERLKIGKFFVNTMVLIVLKAATTMISCSLVAYGFVRYRYRYKEWIFAVFMAAMMIPGELLTIPQYEIYIELGWMDSYLPMVVPRIFATDIFAIFMFRQFFRKVPSALFEAAKIDGCGELRMYWSIMVPQCKSVFVTIFLLYFIGTYNDIYEANLYILSDSKYTLAQGLRLIETMYKTGSRDYLIPWNLLSAGTLIALIPVFILFFLGQKQFIEGMASSGIKE